MNASITNRQHGWAITAILVFVVFTASACYQASQFMKFARQVSTPSLQGGPVYATEYVISSKPVDGGGAQKSISQIEPTTKRPVVVNVYLKRLYAAIGEKESKSWDWAVGDRGASKGRYQIQRGYWRDACEYAHTTLDYDVYVTYPRKAELVMYWYWSRYCPEALADYLQTGSLESAAILVRVHNGGPKGHLKKATFKYGQDIRRKLLCGAQ